MATPTAGKGTGAQRIAVQVDRVGIEWEEGGQGSLFWEGSFSVITERGRMIMGVWRKESKRAKLMIISEYRLRKGYKEAIARLVDELLSRGFPGGAVPSTTGSGTGAP